MYDSHIHTNFSADCATPLEDVLKAALTKRIKTIAVTDHIDYKYHNGMRFEFDTSAYSRTIAKKQAEYDGKLEILKGVELGIKANVLDMCNQLMSAETFDFVIASMHGCQGEDFYFGHFFDDKRPLEAMQIYLSEMLMLIKSYSNFDVLGHIDLPKRYNKDVAKLGSGPLLDHYKAIFSWLVANGKGIEVNTSGLRQEVGVQFPDNKILNLYYECGGRIITIGSDSHLADTLCEDFESILKTLKEIGFESICTFKNRRVRYHNISEILNDYALIP